MDENKIMEIAEKKGMKNTTLFVKFFSKRFPNESNNITSYVSEWVDRFMSGNPTAYMDKESLSIYKNLIERKGKD